jgi:hypothetical protein
MSTVFKVVYSDIKGKPIIRWPLIWSTNFRRFNSARVIANRLHEEGRDIVIIERDDNGMVATWEKKAGGED